MADTALYIILKTTPSQLSRLFILHPMLVHNASAIGHRSETDTMFGIFLIWNYHLLYQTCLSTQKFKAKNHKMNLLNHIIPLQHLTIIQARNLKN